MDALLDQGDQQHIKPTPSQSMLVSLVVYVPNLKLPGFFTWLLPLKVPRLTARSAQKMPALCTLSNVKTRSISVDALEWRDWLALFVIEGRVNDVAVCEINLAVGLLLERERVLHPAIVVSLREILTSMGPT